jgi:predicted RNA-binding Zn-ribbon protein involved in translation (DUF1610 family)
MCRLDIWSAEPEPAIRAAIDINQLTPLDALWTLKELKDRMAWCGTGFQPVGTDNVAQVSNRWRTRVTNRCHTFGATLWSSNMPGITYCPRCGGSMEVGFLMDASVARGYAEPTRWAEGQPIPSIWSGVKNKVRRRVDTYRCTECGYLESYAVTPDD